MCLKLKTGIALPLVLFALSGCIFDDCRYVDCSGGAPFRFVIENSEGEAIFGSTPYAQYMDRDSIGVFGITNSSELIPVRIIQNQEVFQFTVLPDYDLYLIQYSFSEGDSLAFDCTTYEDECCRKVVSKYQVEINSSNEPVSNEADTVFTFVKL